MTNPAADLVTGLRGRGFILTMRPDPDPTVQRWALVISPVQTLTDDVRALLRQHREAILDFLYWEVPGIGVDGVRWYDEAPPHREEWDEEAQQFVTVPGRRPWSPGICPQPRHNDPPPPPFGREIEFPAGAVLFWQDARGRPCKPGVALRWCWEGGPGWYDARRNPPSGVPLVDRKDELEAQT